MRSRGVVFVCVVTLFVIATSALAQDKLSGNWTGDWGPRPVLFSLKWDGNALTGSMTGGEDVMLPIPIQKGTFDPKTGKIHIEIETKSPPSGQTIRFLMDGKLDGGTLRGTWNYDNRKGDFTLTKK